jgi:hypothetical protein
MRQERSRLFFARGRMKLLLQIAFVTSLFMVMAVSAYGQNYQFTAQFGGSCTIGSPTAQDLQNYPDVSPNDLVPDGETVATGNNLGNGTGAFRQFNQLLPDGTFFVNHGRFTFQFDGVLLQGHYLGRTAPFNPALIGQYGVLVGNMGGPFIVTKVVAAKNACTAPDDLSSVCSKGTWTGTVRLIPAPAPHCLLSLEFRSDGAATR